MISFRTQVVLDKAELAEAMGHEHLVVAAGVDVDAGLLVAVMGDLSIVTAPLSDFRTSGDGTVPNFHALSVTDYGHTVAFGDYEVAADALNGF